MVYNKLDEDIESGVGVNGRQLKERRGEVGDLDIMTAPKYCGNGLLMRINCGGSSSPTRSRYETT